MSRTLGRALFLTVLIVSTTPARAFDTPAEFAGFVPPLPTRFARTLVAPEQFSEIIRTPSDWRPAIADEEERGFLDAARRADWSEVASRLKAGANPNASDEGRGRVLPLAAAAGEIELVRQLLAAGAHPDARGDNGMTPLGAAAVHGHLQLVRLLLKQGVDPERTNANGNTPLLEAAALDRLEAFELLLAAGADPMRMNRDGHHALSLAAASGSLQVMNRLLRHGIAPDTPDRRLQSPLYWAMHQQQDEAVAALIAAGARYDSMTPTMRR